MQTGKNKAKNIEFHFGILQGSTEGIFRVSLRVPCGFLGVL
jgi:hypothetical protein